MKTIAQQLNVKDFPFSIKDANGNEIYSEYSNGFWYRKEWDADSRQIYSINSNGYWWRGKYDANGNKIYFEDSTGMILDNWPTNL
jgi:hypothetical protein